MISRRLLLLSAALLPVACVPPQPVMLPPLRYNLATDVLFAFGSADLLPQAAGALNDVLARIRASYRQTSLLIEGHTDSIGSDQVNDALSLRRADAVRQYFIAAGFPPQLIRTQGLGKRQPIAPNTTPTGADFPEGRARNRRVEIIATAI